MGVSQARAQSRMEQSAAPESAQGVSSPCVCVCLSVQSRVGPSLGLSNAEVAIVWDLTFLTYYSGPMPGYRPLSHPKP